ncbi:sphingomyelin phosphodiesterase [Exophiala viscosa]|uniref:sphingomyelin phosphodiesterase n=1 Tax=Exophiala viscosa TaxID=2486360 RepID=UPI0021A154DB|nr:sphingomyelin phosphodiesterase [Exophiala viscosa]
MHCSRLFLLSALSSCTCQLAYAQSSSSQVLAYTVPAGFPTSLFPAYYIPPSPTREPQPILYDSTLNYTFPFSLTDPYNIPQIDEDPVYYPTPLYTVTNTTALIANATSQLSAILAANGTNCTKCMSALEVGQYVAQRAPSLVPDLLVELCISTKFSSNATCTDNYQAGSFGAIWTQILALANVSGSDGHYICNSLSSTFCSAPYTLPSNTTAYFGAKPANITVPKASGNRVKVLHMSDIHIDPRYAVASEANCSSGLCCRANAASTSGQVTLPAPLHGSFKCDSPYFLITSALESIAPLTGTTHNNQSQDDQFAWSIYTGDLVSHESQNELSRNYTMYAEWSIYHMLKAYIPSGPIFPVLGNHDSNPEAIDSPHSLPGNLGQQQSWNYDHVSALWQQNGWISADAANEARMHYAAYSINHPTYPKLRIITLNTDFWYKSNYLNFINTTNPDVSGNLMFLATELQDAENKGERVWIIGHVLTGWDGSNPIPNPTDLFYQIIDRYSPHVIAEIFFGHTHEDEFMIYYANNGTVQDAAHALAVGWIGPSVTTLTNLNSGYRMYEVDTGDFSIYNAYTYYTNVSTFTTLNTTHSGPTWKFEYSTRDAYPIGWPTTAPLNATYWHQVTEAMAANHSLVSKFNTFEGKSSVKSPNCTSNACAEAKICYMRSGSVALGAQCPQGFGSVQSAFTGKNF